MLKQFVDDARATVHILGAVYDPAVQEQISLAVEAEKKIVFWQSSAPPL